MGLKKLPAIRAAFVGFGEVNTPRDIVERKCGEARKAVEARGIELVWTEPVSDDPAGKDVARAIRELSGKEFDFIILCLAGWIPSHAVVSIADEFAHKPMVLWGLTGWMRDGTLVTAAAQAGTTALRKAFEDLGYRHRFIYDRIGSPPRADEVAEFGKAERAGTASRAVSPLRGAKVGMMGFRDMNLYTTLYDGMSLKARLGVEVEFFEMLEMEQRAAKADGKAARAAVEKMKKEWVFEKPADEDFLMRGAKYWLALDAKVKERGYGAVSLIDVDGMKKLLGFPPAMIFMLLADETGVATIPENDVLGSVTQLVARHLTGQCAAYMEFYEFMEDRVLMGVPDFVPSEVVDGKVRVLPTKFGEQAAGLLNVSKVKTGRVTLCRLTSSGDRYSMHIVTGEAVAPRKWEEAGWEQPAPMPASLEVILDSPVEEFARKVMSQHYIVLYGDQRDILADFCGLTGVTVI